MIAAPTTQFACLYSTKHANLTKFLVSLPTMSRRSVCRDTPKKFDFAQFNFQNQMVEKRQNYP